MKISSASRTWPTHLRHRLVSKGLTGGLVNYYLAPVLHPQRKEQPAYVAECEDIAEALQLTPNEFCEFKAIWRTAAARLGNGKPDHKCLYDAEKRLHYAGRDVAKYRRELEDGHPEVATPPRSGLNQGANQLAPSTEESL
jgi:hypothetical protein